MPTKELTLDAWNKAARIWCAAAISNPRGPQDLAAQLLAYIHFINSLAEKGFDWRFYDINFRQKRGPKRYDC